MIYLASPYSHPDENVVFSRFGAVVDAVANLYARGINAYSPIAHSHPVAGAIERIASRKFGTYEDWRSHDEEMMSLCTHFVVLALHGWEQSQGVLAEIEYASGIGRQIRIVPPYDISSGRWTL